MIQQQSMEILGNGQALLGLEIPAQNTASEYQKVLTKYAKDIELKGFRKGKVPPNLLERKFGKELRSQTFQDLLQQCIADIQNQVEPKPLPYAPASLCEGDGTELNSQAISALANSLQPGEVLSLYLAYDIAPSLPEPSLQGLSLHLVRTQITAADIEQKLADLRQENSVMMPRKDAPGQEGDLLLLSFGLLKEGQQEPEMGNQSLARLRIGEAGDSYGLHDFAKPLCSGETTLIEHHQFPDTEDVDPDLRGKSGRVWLQVVHIHTPELPELDDDFAQDIDDKYQTLEELRTSILHEQQESSKQLVEKYHLLQIYRHWAQTLDFPIPRSMAVYHTQEAIKHIKQHYSLLSDEDWEFYLEMRYGDAETGLLAVQKEMLERIFIELVRDKYLQAQGWEVSEEERQQKLQHIAAQQNCEVEKLHEYYQGKAEQLEQQVESNVLQERLNRHLLEKARQDLEADSLSVEVLSTESLNITELQTRLADLEQDFRKHIYQKFSPFPELGDSVS